MSSPRARGALRQQFRRYIVELGLERLIEMSLIMPDARFDVERRVDGRPDLRPIGLGDGEQLAMTIAGSRAPNCWT